MMAAPPTPPTVQPKRTEFIRALSAMLGARPDAFADNVCRAFIVYYDRIMDAGSLLKRLLRELRHGTIGSAILLRRWIEMRARIDFSNRVLLNSLVDGIRSAAKRFGTLAEELNRSKLALLRAFRVKAQNHLLTSPAPTLRSLAADAPAKFFDSDPVLIASAMAYSGSKSFGAVPLYELGVRAEKIAERAPHLAADIARSDRISHWVASNVLFQNSPKAQERAIHHFVKIAFFAVKLGDLASSTAIMNGFTLNVVGRLFRHLWHLSSAICSVAAGPQRIASATHDYESLRKEIDARRSASQPVMPFLGYYLKKLEFANAGNPWVLDPTGDINSAKLEVLGKLLGEIEGMQRESLRAFAPPGARFPSYITQMLDKMPRKSEDALEARSCDLRPRGNVDSESVSAILFSASSSRSENSENDSGSGSSDRDMVELHE